MDLTPRQKKAVRKLNRTEGGAFWWRVGTGKTRLAYASFAMIAKHSDAPSHHFLVVCRREAFEDWENEVERLELPWRVRVIESEADLFGFYKNNGRTTIHLISHGKLANMRDHILDYANAFEGVAFDEGFLYKNSQSHHCKAAHRLSEMIGPAWILSGSIMTARNLEDIYGQLYAVNRHHVLGQRPLKTIFRASRPLDPGSFGSRRTRMRPQSRTRGRSGRSRTPTNAFPGRRSGQTPRP